VSDSGRMRRARPAAKITAWGGGGAATIRSTL
jgi:hypothetical protein